MAKIDEYQVLLGRSREFLIEAEEALNGGRYDLACFLAERSVQLRLKAELLRMAEDYPRSHNLRISLSKLLEIVPGESRSRLMDYVRKNRSRISELEDAYIMARYTTKGYGEEDARDLLEVAREIFELLDEVLEVEG